MSNIFTAFTELFFKRGSNSEETPEKPVPVAAPTGETGKYTVLAIDDDATVLDTLRPMLRMEGFNVITAHSGMKALDLVRFSNKDVRVVLLDYNMPRLTGAEAIQHLRRFLPNAKILGLTGVAAADLPETFSGQVDKLMAKPYRSSELVKSINDLISLDAAVSAQS